jgi:hypothetical protein
MKLINELYIENIATKYLQYMGYQYIVGTVI